MQSALVNLSTGRVDNIIVADPAVDKVDAGYVLIGNPPNFVVIGTKWSGGSKFVAPPVPIGGAAPVIRGVETI